MCSATDHDSRPDAFLGSGLSDLEKVYSKSNHKNADCTSAKTVLSTTFNIFASSSTGKRSCGFPCWKVSTLTDFMKLSQPRTPLLGSSWC